MEDGFMGNRRKSVRLQAWDYRNAGAYFVTICTQHRRPYFGRVANGAMHLSPLGEMAYAHWQDIDTHHAGVTLGEFVVMPNHVHGILHLPEGAMSFAKTSASKMSAISPKAGSLSAIVRSYKSAVSREAGCAGLAFAWQPRFYEHVVRSEESYRQISEYILGNPLTWAEDELFCGDR
ncbi:MAG: hypothetical protein Q4A06_06205 [Cardiobacteriaceae bacterium]|nr:hypothetical protein [Cardiobacteriaceae bacterium]